MSRYGRATRYVGTLVTAAVLAGLAGGAPKLALTQAALAQTQDREGAPHPQGLPQPQPQTQFLSIGDGRKAPAVPDWAAGTGPVLPGHSTGAEPRTGWPGTSRSGPEGGGAIGLSGNLGAPAAQAPQSVGNQDEWLDREKQVQDERARGEKALTGAPAPQPDLWGAPQAVANQDVWLDQEKQRQEDRGRDEKALTHGQPTPYPEMPPHFAVAQSQPTSSVGADRGAQTPSETLARETQHAPPRGTKTYVQTLPNPHEEPPAKGPMSADEYRERTLSNGAFTKSASDAALQHASDPRVKIFAKFEEAEQNAMAAVLAGGSTPSPPQPDPQQAKALGALQSVAPGQFDRAYLDLEIGGHREALHVQQRYLSDGSADPELAHVATLAQTTIREHLDLLNGLRRSLDEKQAEGKPEARR